MNVIALVIPVSIWDKATGLTQEMMPWGSICGFIAQVDQS